MADDSILKISVKGITHALDLKEFTPRDAMDFRTVTGTRLVDAIVAPDLDHVAAFVWLQRRRLERKLTFEQVADDLTLGDLQAVEDDEAPEAQGGN